MPTGAMEIIVPITVTDTILTSSDVPENDYSAWDSGTTYALDDFVIVTTPNVHKIYQSEQGSNLNHNPVTDDGTWWAEISATNRWKMFDGKTGSATSQTGTITTELTPGTVFNSVALLGVDADTVNIYAVSDSVTNEVTNGTFDTDTDWTKGTGWSIGSGVASCDGSQPTFSSLTQVIDDGAGGYKYFIRYTVKNLTAGFVQMFVDYNVAGTARTTNGTFTDVVTSTTGLGRVNFVANPTFVGEIDNVEVYKAIYDESLDMKDLTLIDGYYDWFFSPIANKTTVVKTDLPAYADGVLTVEVDNGTDTAELGELIVGKVEQIGVAEYGTSVGIADYSRKETDDDGNFIITERRFAKTVDYGISLASNRVDRVQRLLAAYRATPIVYIGDESLQETIVYGFFRDFNIVLENFNRSSCSLQVEEI